MSCLICTDNLGPKSTVFYGRHESTEVCYECWLDPEVQEYVKWFEERDDHLVAVVERTAEQLRVSRSGWEDWREGLSSLDSAELIIFEYFPLSQDMIDACNAAREARPANV